MFNIDEFVELINSDLSDEEVVDEIFKLIPNNVQKIYSSSPQLRQPLASYEGIIGKDDAVTAFYGTWVLDQRTYVGKVHFDLPSIYPQFIKYTRTYLKKVLLRTNNDYKKAFFKLITTFMDYYFQRGNSIELRQANADFWNANKENRLAYKKQLAEYEKKMSTDDAIAHHRDLHALSIAQREDSRGIVIAHYPLSAFIGLDGNDYRIGQCVEHNLFAHNLACLVGLNPILTSARFHGHDHTFIIIPNDDKYLVFDPFNKIYGGDCEMKGENHYDGLTITVTKNDIIHKYEIWPRKLVFERESDKTK